MDTSTELEFTAYLREAALRAKTEAGYNANQFVAMLGSKGGFATARDLLASPSLSEGFVKLWTLGRLDLSVEALVLEGRWKSAFEEPLLQIARRRLIDAKYALKEFAGAPELGSGKGSVPDYEDKLPERNKRPLTNLTSSRSSEYRPAPRTWRVTGPIENFATAIQRGVWALSDKNISTWQQMEPGDLVFFHSTRESTVLKQPPSAIIGFARIGKAKYRKSEEWWLDEIANSENRWPNAVHLTDICVASESATAIIEAQPIASLSTPERVELCKLLLQGSIQLSDLEALANRVNPGLPKFPVNGSASRISETYRWAILDIRDWLPIDASVDTQQLEEKLLSAEDLQDVSNASSDDLFAAALSYEDAYSSSHKERLGRVRVENARQKARVAKLEDHMCQVCGYQRSYVTTSGTVRWICHVDHIVEKSRGGGEALGNLWVLCPNCHAEKTAGLLVINPETHEVVREGITIEIRDVHLAKAREADAGKPKRSLVASDIAYEL